MKLTNDLSLPEPIVNAVRNDDYSPGDCDYSVTQLIKPVRIVALGKKYREHIVEDASDRIFSLFGRAMHKVLELAADPRYCMVEKRHYANFRIQDGFIFETFRVGGQFDVMDYVVDTETHTLSDYKLCSRYVTGEGVKPEWEQQENMNAFILKRNGFKIDKLQIVAIFRDWSKMQAGRKEDYPQKQVEILPVPMWLDAKTEQFIRERIRAHEEGKTNPPVCSPEERWRKPDRWALMKKGSKRALRLFDEQAQAEAAARGVSFYYVEPRPGEDIRCQFYCPVNKYCDYYQEQMQEKIA